MYFNDGSSITAIVGDQKADKDTVDGKYHYSDSSVIEFIVNREGGKNDKQINSDKLRMFPEGICTIVNIGYFNLETEEIVVTMD